VHRHPGRLVHHEQGRVFVDDRKFRGFCLALLSLRNPDRRHAHPVARLQPVLGLHAAAVDPHLAAAQDPVDMAFRHALETAQQEIVDALRRRFFADFQGGRPSLA
jgi:hypothetical protein